VSLPRKSSELCMFALVNVVPHFLPHVFDDQIVTWKALPGAQVIGRMLVRFGLCSP